MADLTLVQGIADLRLNETTLRRDLQQARRLILNTARDLERQLRLTVPVELDLARLRAQVRRLNETLGEIGGLVVPVDADLEPLLTTLGTFDPEPIVVPVQADLSGAPATVTTRVEAEADTFTVPVDDETVVVSVDADLGPMIVTLDTFVPKPVTVPVDVDTASAVANLGALGEAVRTSLEGVGVFNASGIVEGLTAAIRRISGLFSAPVGVPLNADTDQLTATLGAFDPEPIVTAVVLDDTAARAGLVTLYDQATEPVEKPIGADVSPAVTAAAGLDDQLTEGVEKPVGADITAGLQEVAVLREVASRPVAMPVQVSSVTPDAVPVIPASQRGGIGGFGLERIRSELGSVTGSGPGFDALRIPSSIDPPDTSAVTAVTESLESDPTIIPSIIEAPDTAPIVAVERRLEDDPIALTAALNDDIAAAQLEFLRRQQESDPIDLPVTTSFDGFDADDVFDQAAFGAAGEAAGLSFGQRAIGSIQKIFVTSSAVLGGFLGLSLVRGFQRYTTIEDSVASLTVQLQSASEAATLLDEVLGVVTGTPFNLDQFAEAASNMVAFGIEANKIPGYLTAISEVAATRGGRANEYAQRLAISFGQVAVQGRITNDEVTQLALTGVPALQILGNAFNETAGDMRDLISKGVVPAQAALDALAKGILEGSDGINGATVAFAGTAEALRETLTGSIGGFQSATARFGVSIIKPLDDTLIAGFQGATAAVDLFGKAINEQLGGLAESPEIESFIGILQDLPLFVEDIIDGLKELGPAAAPLLAVLGGLSLGSIGAILGPLGNFLPGITGPIGALTVAITTLIATTPELREDFLPILAQIGQIGATLGATIGPAVASIAEDSIPILSAFFEVVDELLPIVEDGAAVFGGFVQVFAAGFGVLSDVISAFPLPVLTAIGGALAAYATFRITSGPLLSLADGLIAITRATIGLPGRLGQVSGGLAVFRREADLGQRSAARAATGIAAAFSGMALAADDATTQVSGAIGAISSIALGFATGGAIGGGIAALATGIGYVAGEFINARQEAEEFARTVTASAEAIVEDLSEVELAAAEVGVTFDDFRINSDDRAVEDFIEALGDDLFSKLEEIPGFGLEDLLALDPESIDPSIAKLEELRDAVQNFDALTDSNRLDEAFQNFDFSGIERLPETFDEVAVAIGAVVRERTKNEDINAIARLEVEQQVELNKRLNESFDEQQRLLADLTGLGLPRSLDPEQIEVVIDLLDRYGSGQQALEDQLNLTLQAEQALQRAREKRWRDELVAAGAVGAQIEEIIALARELDQDPVEIFDQRVYDGFPGLGIEIAGLIDTAEEFPDLSLGIEDAIDATKAWDAVMADVGDNLDGIGDALDRISARGDIAAQLRGIGEGLNEIVNEAELRKAEQVADQVERQLERVEDASDRLEEAALEFSFNEQIALANIAEAEAAGAFKGAIAARRDLERDRLEVQQLAEDVAEEERRLAELQGEAAKLAAIGPVTFGDVLRQQAAAQGVSLFDLLLTQPTDESREAFREFIEGPAKAALAEIEALLEDGDLTGAAELAVRYQATFAAAWSEAWGAGTGERLVGEIFDVSDFESSAEGAADVWAQFFGDNVDDSLADYVAEVRASALSDEEFAASEVNAFIGYAQSLLAEDDGKLVAQLGFDPEQVLAELEVLRQIVIDRFWADLLESLPDTGIAGTDPNFFLFKEGGIMPADHTAHVARSIRVFGEPETGGEAYIPLTPDPIQRRRSVALLGEVASIFGMPLVDDRRSVSELQAPVMSRLDSVVTALQAPVTRVITKELTRQAPVHTAHIARSIRVFGERETGGEAYIPLTPDPIQRRRSVALLGEVASIFGMPLVDDRRSVSELQAPVMSRLDSVVTTLEVPVMSRLDSVVTALQAPVQRVDSVVSTLQVPVMSGRVDAVVSNTDRIADAVADGVARAMVVSKKREMAREYAEAVHIEHLHIGGSGSDRRTARRLINDLADLSLRRRR